MLHDISRAPVSAPPDAPTASPPERLSSRLFACDLDFLRAQMGELGLGPEDVAGLAAMNPGQVECVLTTGKATRIQVRRIRRGLRRAWSAKVGAPADVAKWRALTMRRIAPGIGS